MKRVLTKRRFTFKKIRESGISCRTMKSKALNWADQFDTVSYLDSNGYMGDKYRSFECMVAVGKQAELVANVDAFEQLKAFYETHKTWLFGFLSYDLKNEVENLTSNNFDGIGFPRLHFFVPQYLLEISHKAITIHAPRGEHENILSYILDSREQHIPFTFITPKVKPRISKKEYLAYIKAIRQHIVEGDFYEMNFCQEFYAENCRILPSEVFLRLNEIALAPYACFYKWNERYLLSASPERFIKKIGNSLISQPIKGTIKRGKNKKKDDILKEKLANSEKDRAENVMIVDLVRNDFSRSCQAGTVSVEELFGIYTFQQVHQMISTVKGTLKPDIHFVDAIKNAFPMGSMTGAPKPITMETIEAYEHTQRGLYSGAVGYISPDGDFDFNVVIRSILYNNLTNYLSFQVGGAIVYDSEPESEYEECLLKAKAMRAVLREPVWA